MTTSTASGRVSRPKRPWRAFNLLTALVGLLLAELLAWWWLRTGVWERTGLGFLFFLAVVAVTLAVVIVWLLARALAHNRFQFGLRTLLIAVGIIALGLGAIVSMLQRSADQRRCVARLLAAGAQVTYRNEDQRGLKALIGKQYFEDVVDVLWVCEPSGRANLAYLDGLKKLESLRLWDAKLTDADLAHLERLSELKRLYLVNCSVPEKALKHLEGLDNLRELPLSGSNISDAQLVYLAELPRLELLYLELTPVTDAGLIHLKGLANLQQLNLGSTQVTDAGLGCLMGLTKLNWLNLPGTRVSNQGLKRLGRALPRITLNPAALGSPPDRRNRRPQTTGG